MKPPPDSILRRRSADPVGWAMPGTSVGGDVLGGLPLGGLPFGPGVAPAWHAPRASDAARSGTNQGNAIDLIVAGDAAANPPVPSSASPWTGSCPVHRP